MLPIIRRRGGYRPVFMSDLFDTNFDSFTFRNGSKSFSPAVNIKEDDKQYDLEFALPGMSKDDIKIEIEKDVIIISSEQKQEKTEEKNGYTVKEFGNFSFCKSYRLPEHVKAEKITAQFTDGILKVELPKSEAKAKLNRTIKIS